MNIHLSIATVISVFAFNQIHSQSFFATGYSTSARVCNGKLFVTGSNSYSQLGNGTSGGSSNTPLAASVLTSGVTMVSGGGSHIIALKSDGTVWAWGWNNFGQLGIGNTTDSNVPVQVSGLSNISKVYSGSNHCMALKNDGSVWTWGYNGSGQLGNNTTNSSNVPIQVTGISGVNKIAAGRYHCLALKSDGTLWTWGSNVYGQLGNGTNTQSKIPVQISLTNVIQIAAGEEQSLALKSDGTVWAWGYNNLGQLGTGNTSNSNVPVQVSGLGGITDISTLLGDHCVALKNDGTVYTWGYNFYGQLGNNTTTSSNTPIQVTSLTDVVNVEAGGNSCIAEKSDGTLWAWGGNVSGELGDGTYTGRKTPVYVGTACNYMIGLNENSLNDAVSLFPNPSNGTVQLNSENVTIDHIKIYDVTGKLSKSIAIENVNQAIHLNLVAGVYFYKLLSDNTVIRGGKIIIE